jgi:hypothetical protein
MSRNRKNVEKRDNKIPERWKITRIRKKRGKLPFVRK